MNTLTSSHCVVCDSAGPSIRSRDFKKTYVPDYTYGVLILAPLIGLLLMIGLRVEHNVTLPYCDKCWKGKRFATALQGLCGILFFASIPAGFALMLQMESGWAFFVPPVITLGMILVLEVFKRKYQPKYKVVNKERVVVQTREGDLEFAKTTKATLHPA